MSKTPDSESSVGVGEAGAEEVSAAAGIGAALRAARERQGLSLAQVETRLKIRDRYLRALEDERWDALPGYAFAKGFLRSYATLLGLDGEALVVEFKAVAQDPAELELVEVLPESRGDRRLSPLLQAAPGAPRRRAIPLLATLAVLALAGAAIYASGVLNGHHGPATGSRGQITANHGTTAPSHHRPHGVTVHNHARGGTTAPSRLSLQLVPTGRVWVCLIAYPTAASSSGVVTVDGILTPTSPRPVFTAANHFLVTFGDDLVHMTIDGSIHDVAATPTNVVHYAIERDGSYQEIPRSAAPNCG